MPVQATVFAQIMDFLEHRKFERFNWVKNGECPIIRYIEYSGIYLYAGEIFRCLEQFAASDAKGKRSLKVVEFAISSGGCARPAA
jgi:hypothetical protein